MENMETLCLAAIHAAVAAGKEILKVYQTDFEVDFKADKSPLTLADRLAHDAIVRHLDHFGIPLLSEEGRDIPEAERKAWSALWIIDPLDGTKEFIKKNDEFTVNIALVAHHTPVMGVVYVPVKDQLYFACHHSGAYKLENATSLISTDPGAKKEGRKDPLSHLISNALKLPTNKALKDQYTVMGSRSHPSDALADFIRELEMEHGPIHFIAAGSSLKICRVAEGAADIYPRLGPTMEWDTAAGHAVAKYAGMELFNHDTGNPLVYNKTDLLNPWFIVKKQSDSEK